MGAYLNGRPNGGVLNSSNLNLYAYTAQNPVKYVDPTGLSKNEDGTDRVDGLKGATPGGGFRSRRDDKYIPKSMWQFRSEKGLHKKSKSVEEIERIRKKKAVHKKFLKRIGEIGSPAKSLNDAVNKKDGVLYGPSEEKGGLGGSINIGKTIDFLKGNASYPEFTIKWGFPFGYSNNKNQESEDDKNLTEKGIDFLLDALKDNAIKGIKEGIKIFDKTYFDKYKKTIHDPAGRIPDYYDPDSYNNDYKPFDMWRNIPDTIGD
ncbi:MAG: hypothetical protein IEMM0008_0336 [bacterium]|nr:MAG: hypothetical protein IEMM0008_0336 [bacterium]